MATTDITRVFIVCGCSFVIAAGEQNFLSEKAFSSKTVQEL